jgi:hypothetical protein
MSSITGLNDQVASSPAPVVPAPHADAFMFIDNQGVTKGPVPRSVLMKLLRKGIGISAQTLVWKPDFENWLPIHAVEVFKEEIELQHQSWYYVDGESGEQRGPIPSR